MLSNLLDFIYLKYLYNMEVKYTPQEKKYRSPDKKKESVNINIKLKSILWNQIGEYIDVLLARYHISAKNIHLLFSLEHVQRYCKSSQKHGKIQTHCSVQVKYPHASRLAIGHTHSHAQRYMASGQTAVHLHHTRPAGVRAAGVRALLSVQDNDGT